MEGNRFYHPDLRFQLAVPSGWQTQNSPSAFVMGEPNGRAVIQMTLASEGSAQAAGRALAAQQGVTAQTSRATSVNGNTGYLVEGTAAQQNGSVAFSATFVEYGGNVYQLLGLTAAASFNQYAPTFRSTAGSFARLTDRQYINRQPSRLEVMETRSRTTIQDLLRGRTIPDGITADEIAIMNQVTLTEAIPAGTSVKLPG